MNEKIEARDVMPYDRAIDKVLMSMCIARENLGEEVTEAITEYYISARELDINHVGTIDSDSDIEVWFTLWDVVSRYVTLNVYLSHSQMAEKIIDAIQQEYDDNAYFE